MGIKPNLVCSVIGLFDQICKSRRFLNGHILL